MLDVLIALADPARSESVQTAPTWVHEPMAMNAPIDAHPLFATMFGIEGRVRLDCVVLQTGRADDCWVEAVAPSGLGFEDAALGSVAQLRFNQGVANARTNLGRVSFVMLFPAAEDPPVVDPTAWPKPTGAALAAIRPIAKWMVEKNDATTTSWDVSADRSAFVAGLVAEVNQEMQLEKIEALTLAMARTLTEEEARDFAEATDPWPQALVDKVYAQSPEDQMQHRSFMQIVRGRYCAAYDCSSELPRD